MKANRMRMRMRMRMRENNRLDLCCVVVPFLVLFLFQISTKRVV
jgi:hypothetical protein